MSTYKITSQEGAEYANADVGAEVELDLNESDERALICAGWIAPATKTKEG